MQHKQNRLWLKIEEMVRNMIPDDLKLWLLFSCAALCKICFEKCCINKCSLIKFMINVASFANYQNMMLLQQFLFSDVEVWNSDINSCSFCGCHGYTIVAR